MAKKKDLLPVEHVSVRQADGSVVQAEIIEVVGPLVIHETLCDARLADAKSAAYSITHRATGLGLAAGVQSKKTAITLAHDLNSAAESESLDLDKAELSQLHDQQPAFTLFLARALELRAASRVRKGFLYSTIDALPGEAKPEPVENWLPEAAEKLKDLFKPYKGLEQPQYDLPCTYQFKDLGKRKGGQIVKIRDALKGDRYEIFISTRYGHPIGIMATLLHEMVHQFVGVKCGHRGMFRYIAKKVGLLAPMTSSIPSKELCEYLMSIRQPHWVGKGDVSNSVFLADYPLEGLCSQLR